MVRPGGLFISLLLAVFLTPATGAGLADGEVSVLAAAATGDYGADFDSDARWFTLRYIAGDDFQLRAELSMVSMTTVSGSGFTSSGPSGMGGNGWQGGKTSNTPGPHGEPIAGIDEISAQGLGDLYLAASKRVVGGNARLFRLDANVEVKVPTANEEENLGTGEWDYRVGFSTEYRFWSATAYGGLGWNRLGDPAWVDFADGVDAYVGIDSNPIARGRLILGGWVEGWQEVIEADGHRASLGIGVRTTGKVRWRLQLRTGLTDATANVAALVGVSFGVTPAGPGIRGPQL